MAFKNIYKRMTELTGKIPDLVWAPFAGGVLMLAAGLFGLLAGRPWIFPSLGPTAYLQAAAPRLPSSRFYNTLAGHVIGLLAGFFTVWATGANSAPIVLSTHILTAPRVWASLIAVMLTLIGNLALKCTHPPAAATTLLIALGAFRTFQDAVNVLIGVLIISFLGELFRAARVTRTRPEPAFTKRK